MHKLDSKQTDASIYRHTNNQRSRSDATIRRGFFVTFCLNLKCESVMWKCLILLDSCVQQTTLECSYLASQPLATKDFFLRSIIGCSKFHVPSGSMQILLYIEISSMVRTKISMRTVELRQRQIG